MTLGWPRFLVTARQLIRREGKETNNNPQLADAARQRLGTFAHPDEYSASRQQTNKLRGP
jgi:hypothetical protein